MGVEVEEAMFRVSLTSTSEGPCPHRVLPTSLKAKVITRTNVATGTVLKYTAEAYVTLSHGILAPAPAIGG